MKLKISLLLTICYFCGVLSFPSDVSLVTSTEKKEKTAENEDNDVDKTEVELVDETLHSLTITEMKINTNVANRFAKTLIASHVKNFDEKAQNAVFSVVLPDSAYISSFVMEIDGKSYKANVKEKEEATQIYNQAVEAGQSAGRVEVSARDSNRFTVDINVEPNSKAVFLLTYEELLQRKNEQYEIVLNIQPGEVIKDLTVEVDIRESRPLKFVRTPSLRSGNEINKNNEGLEPNTDIQIVNETSAIVKFKPDAEQQRQFAEKLGTDKENGLAGQFVVQYDVERDPQKGEILLHDGYFVHFFGPDDIPPLPKHVIFVLDISASMEGRKIQQLREAMLSILPELKPEDLFTIITFESDLQVLNIEESVTKEIRFNGFTYTRDQIIAFLGEMVVIPDATPANADNIEKAKTMVRNLQSSGATNIIGALELGLFVAHKARVKASTNYTNQPMIIFLTDGEPNVGMSNTDEIVNKITDLNTGEERVPIFSLSFGSGADKKFLKKLSHKNLGFSRHIYEASDAHLQLQDFYQDISSPLLTGVTFEYVKDEVTDVTRNKFPIYFGGSELVVAGRYSTPHTPRRNSCIHPTLGVEIIDPGFGGMEVPDGPGLQTCVPIAPVGWGTRGRVVYRSVPEAPVPHNEGDLERIWAYLTIKQKLEDRETAENKTVLTKEALDLALKYSFVTPVSSLVVVKPNATNAINTEDASRPRPKYIPYPQVHYPHYGPPGGAAYYPGWGGGSNYRPALSYSGGTSSYGQGHLMVSHRGRPANRYLTGPSYPSSGWNLQPTGQVANRVPGPSYPGYPRSDLAVQSRFIQTLPPQAPHDVRHHRSRLSHVLQKYPWVNDILTGNTTITVDGQSYDLGLETEIPHDDFHECSNVDENDSTVQGKCKPLYKCHRDLATLDQYKKHFCIIDQRIAGVCCPREQRHHATALPM